jgi:ribosomal protein L29
MGDYGVRWAISNEELTSDDVPGDAATWPEIFRFASTFSEWVEIGTDAVMAIVEQKHSSTVTELRTRLFVLYRTLVHLGGTPEPEDLDEAREIIARIKALVQTQSRT